MGKIGIGLVTYNAPEKILQSAFSVPYFVDEFVIVNDGTPYPSNHYPSHATIIQHTTNLKVAKAKNDALAYLLGKNCEHIFLMEDDVVISDPLVFSKYIEASEISGIKHLNFALQGPYNFKKKDRPVKIKGDLSDRIFDEKNSEPAPKAIVVYNDNTSLYFYPACVGAFSYFRKKVVADIGLFDETFQNSWEHIEHTYRIIKKGFHPPFGWFADIANSERYLKNIENCMENSSIAKDPLWKKNSEYGEQYFKKLHGYVPGRLPKIKEKGFKKSINNIYSSFNPNKPVSEKLSFIFPAFNTKRGFLTKAINLFFQKRQ